MPKNIEIGHIFDINNDFGYLDEALRRNDLRSKGVPVEYDGKKLKGNLSLGTAVQVMESDLMLDYNSVNVTLADVTKAAGVSAMSNAGAWTLGKLIATGAATFAGSPIAGALTMMGYSAVSDGYEYISALKKAGNPNKFWSTYIDNLRELKEETGIFDDITEQFYNSQAFNKAGDAGYQDMFGDMKGTGAAGLAANVVGSMSNLAAYAMVGGNSGLLGGMTVYSALNRASEEYGITENGRASIYAGMASGTATGLTGLVFLKYLPRVFKKLGAKYVDGMTGSHMQPMAKNFQSLTSSSLGKAEAELASQARRTALRGASKVIPPASTRMGYNPLATYASGGVEMGGWIATEEALEKFMLGENVEVDLHSVGWMFLGGMALKGITSNMGRLTGRAEREARLRTARKEELLKNRKDGVLKSDAPKWAVAIRDDIVDQKIKAQATVNEAVERGANLEVGDIKLYSYGKISGERGMRGLTPAEYADRNVRQFIAEGITDPVKLKGAIWDDLGNADHFYAVMKQIDEIFPSMKIKNNIVASLTPHIDVFTNSENLSLNSKMILEDVLLSSSKGNKVKSGIYIRDLLKESAKEHKALVAAGKDVSMDDVVNVLHTANNMLAKNADKFSYAAKEQFIERYTSAVRDLGYTEKELATMNKSISKLIKEKKRIGVGEVEQLFADFGG